VRSTLPTKPNQITNNNAFSYYNLNSAKRPKNTPPIGPKPNQNVKSKQPPIYRRSKSHERPNMKKGSILQENRGVRLPNMQNHFEEYDLSSIDLVEQSNNLREYKPAKKVSFSSQEFLTDPTIQNTSSKPVLKKMPSYSSLIFKHKTDLDFSSFENEDPNIVNSVVNIETELAPDSVIRKLLNENVLIAGSDNTGDTRASDKHFMF